MERLRRKERDVFVDKMAALPEAPRDLSRLEQEPHLAAFTYLRTECQRCHLGVRGRQKRGDYRHVFRTPANTEGGGAGGQLTLDVSPTQPHTTTGRARSCESCHATPRPRPHGYGIAGGRLNRPWDEPLVVDLMSADRKVLPRSARTQIPTVKGLAADWSRVVSEKGEQLQTVGHHFKLSRPLSNQERAHITRQGVCLSCHEEIPEASLAVGLLHHVAEDAGQLPRTAAEHSGLVHKVLMISGWGQVAGAAAVVLLAVMGVVGLVRRRRKKKASEQ